MNRTSVKWLAALSVVGLLAATLPASASVTVTVDPAKLTNGYMNVFDLPAGTGPYMWGSAWGIDALRASWSGDELKLQSNTNCWAPGDLYWVTAEGTGAKWMDANIYAEDATLIGQDVVFAGKTLANNLLPGYTSQAFIKVLDPGAGWATILTAYAPLVAGTNFSVSLTIPNIPGLVPQYGFVTNGLVSDPASPQAAAYALVAPLPEPTTLLLGLGLAGGLVLRRRR